MPTPHRTEAESTLRLDKWLWTARFYKTRSQATAAIDAGHVRLNGASVKPAREAKPGDTVDLTIGKQRWTVIIQAIQTTRGPAPEAQKLYQETEASVARRIAQKDASRLTPMPGSERGERPTKRDRRQIHRFTDTF